MCGIAGLISYTPDHHQRLSDCLNHRGPDAEGYYVDRAVQFEHKRLSIIDISERGNQPMVSKDENYVIVFNGEIYNHLELRADLIKQGFDFRSSSDTESLLYGYIAYGEKILSRLNGIFAFAIYDKVKQQVFMARDQLGVKPFYIYHRNDCLIFSSEIKALINHPVFEKEIDYTSIFNYLQFLYSPSEATPFKHVKRVDAGHYLIVELHDNSFSVQPKIRYYDIPMEGKYEFCSEKEWIRKLDEALIKAVERQLLSDVPLGFFLSGGLDSSLVVAIAAKALDKKISCFTISSGKEMEEDGFSDDLYYAERVAKALGVKMEVLDTAPEILKDFDKMIWHLDEPQADPAAIHVYNISAGARSQGIKVLLGGTGGDDLFSGYRRHQALALEPLLNVTPKFIRKGVANTIGSFNSQHPTLRRLKKLTENFDLAKTDRILTHFKWNADKLVSSLFNEDVFKQLDQSQLSTNVHKSLLRNIPFEKNDLNQLLYLEMKTFLPNHNLNYTDKMSMAAGVEARVPYLDLDLLNLSTTIPPSLKMRGRQTKYILKKVAEKYLSHDIIYRPKTGFGAPVRKWVQKDLKPMISQRLSKESINKRGIFSPGAIRKVILLNAEEKIDGSYLIFALLAIESWMEQFIDA